MKNRELIGLSEKDLKTKLIELKKEILKIRTQVATGATPKNSGLIRRGRRNIARIKTVINGRGSKQKV